MTSAHTQAAPEVLSMGDRSRLEDATRLHGEGRLAEAEALYVKLLHAPGAQVAVLCFVLGLVRSQQGVGDGAVAWYDKALAQGHASADLFANRAELLGQAGLRVEALAGYEQAIALRPGVAAMHQNRAMLLAELGRGEDTVAAYDKALAIDPANPRTHGNRGVALEKLGRNEDAVDAYVAALKLDPAYRHAHHNLGSVLLKLEQFEFAAESLERANRLDPTAPETWNLYGMALIETERYREGLSAFDRAVALRPAYAEAHNNRSVALRRCGQFPEAVEAAELAFALDSTLVEALSSRGLALCRLNRFEEAVFDFNAAGAARPPSAKFLLNRGVAREGLGDMAGAIEDFRAAQALDPVMPDPKINGALAHLRMGNYAEGWPLYEHRWEGRFGPPLPYAHDKLWLGEQDVAGKTVLLWGEQGFGDGLQFARFATDVAALGARVVLQVKAPLERLMTRLLGPEQVITTEDAPPEFDLFTPLMSLPMALRLPGPAAVRRGVYLSADPEDAIAWRARLGERRALRVGLAWAGNPGHENDHNRSATLDDLAPLTQVGLELISLQKLHTDADLDWLDAAGVPTFGDYLHDFADTAALIEACDAVVAVDTSVAHLAAAMGKPVFMLIPRLADWRWGDHGSDTPWYPRASLLRQQAHGDWSGPVAATVEALALMAKR